MALGWSSSGRFSNSLATDIPQTAINRGQTIFTVPSGTYGPLARLVIMMCGEGTNEFGSSGLTLTASTPHFSADAFASHPRGDTGNIGPVKIPAWWDALFWKQSTEPLPGDSSFWDGGFSVTATSTSATQYTATGTVNTTASTNAVVGTGTLFTTELTVGQIILIAGAFGAGITPLTITSITDDTHLTVNLTANLSLARSVIAAALEDIAWIAAILTFDPATYVTKPLLRGRSSSTDNNDPTLLNTTNFADLSGTTLDTQFGPTDTDSTTHFPAKTTFDFELTDPTSGDFTCVDAFSMVAGYSTSPVPYPIDMAGAANWTNVGNVSCQGFYGQFSVFSAMGHWDRQTIYDTSVKWTGIPITTPPPTTRGGFCRIITWPQSTPTGNPSHPHGFAVVIA